MRTATKKLILRELQENGEASKQELMELLKLERRTVEKALEKLKEAKQIRIAFWIRNNRGNPTRFYGLVNGIKRDAPRPKPLDKKVKAQLWRDRKRAAGIRYWLSRAERAEKRARLGAGLKFDQSFSGEGV